jgi:hypothetical protein
VFVAGVIGMTVDKNACRLLHGCDGAMSPVLKASEAAAVKTPLLVSISAVRARVSAVWAFVTSMKVATPFR